MLNNATAVQFTDAWQGVQGRGSRSQRHCPHRGTCHGTDQNNRICPRTVPGSRFPGRQIITHPTGHLKDASGAAPAARAAPGP
jgi:hypothetical protein